jgi:hypothetical protein
MPDQNCRPGAATDGRAATILRAASFYRPVTLNVGLLHGFDPAGNNRSDGKGARVSAPTDGGLDERQAEQGVEFVWT